MDCRSLKAAGEGLPAIAKDNVRLLRNCFGKKAEFNREGAKGAKADAKKRFGGKRSFGRKIYAKTYVQFLFSSRLPFAPSRLFGDIKRAD